MNPPTSDQLRRTLLERLLPEALSHASWTVFISKLLPVLGFQDVRFTSISHDGCPEGTCAIRLVNLSVRFMATQFPSQPHDGSDQLDVLSLRRQTENVRGQPHLYDRGLLISTGAFSPAATQFAADAPVPIALVSGEDLATVLTEHDIGIRRVPVVNRHVDPSFFSDLRKEASYFKLPTPTPTPAAQEETP